MAVFYDDTAKDLMLDQLGTLTLRLALHTGDPGAANTADNEVTGGSPAYAREAVAWSGAATGAMAQNGDVVFDVPASTTVTWISGWNTAGTVRYFKRLVTSEAFGAQGTYTVVAASSALDLNNDPA
jgi:hypothetical protein